MNDAHYRSFFKAISWRILGSLDTFLVAFLITKRLSAAASIGLIEIFTKMILYYFHERLWNKLKIGKKYNNEQEITRQV